MLTSSSGSKLCELAMATFVLCPIFLRVKWHHLTEPWGTACLKTHLFWAMEREGYLLRMKWQVVRAKPRGQRCCDSESRQGKSTRTSPEDRWAQRSKREASRALVEPLEMSSEAASERPGGQLCWDGNPTACDTHSAQSTEMDTRKFWQGSDTRPSRLGSESSDAQPFWQRS